MVNYSIASDDAPLDATFGALADPTRRAILARLARGEATVTELAAPFDVSLPAVSKHLRVLESAGLLRREIDGRIHRCRLAPEPMKDAAAWIETYRVFWEAQLDALANRFVNEYVANDPTVTYWSGVPTKDHSRFPDRFAPAHALLDMAREFGADATIDVEAVPEDRADWYRGEMSAVDSLQDGDVMEFKTFL